MDFETGKGWQSGGGYDKWQAMKDVKFQGGKPPVIKKDENGALIAPSHETREKFGDKVEKLFGKIRGVKEFVKKKLDVSGSEELTEKTDDALVYVVRETIAAADKDGTRTKEEDESIEEAVSSVVIQGAMEEAGMERSSGGNPILELNNSAAQSDLGASIGTLHAEGVVLSDGESVAGLAARVIERDKKWDLTKVSGRLGSNEGGWYETPEGKRYYVKFYENPSQGQAEFVANAIYQKLGIKAVRSEIIQLDGREAVASPAVVDAKPASKDAQRSSQDVRKGFVADAFLANWDVAGLVFDNIVEGEDGLYRIDNGGSLIFRAQGGDKQFSPDSIPELQTMLKPGRPAGEVFAGITEDEIRRQAQELVGKLTPEDIRAIVDESGLKGEDRDRILNGLLGRREFLVRTYGEPGSVVESQSKPESEERRPEKSVSETIRDIKSREMERSGEIMMRPKTEIVCDRDHIEGQRIDVINVKDKNQIEFRFKLRNHTASEVDKMVEKLKKAEKWGKKKVTMPDGAVFGRGEIVYDAADPALNTGWPRKLCDAFVLERAGVKVFVADPTSRTGGAFKIESSKNRSGLVRSAIGLVKIDVPADMDPEEIEHVVGEIMEKDLGIPGALEEVPETAEKAYKMARYGWEHKVGGELTPEQAERAGKLSREEVFPGYTTFVDRGRHREYLERYGEDMRAVHKLYTGDAASIYRVLTRGLMCTTERFSRGIIRGGESSYKDFDTGGADSVFTRVFGEQERGETDGSMIVFKPELFDRTDWYAYDCDNYGTTDDQEFAWRLSPDALFKMARTDGQCSKDNEQMFRTGISVDYIESIEVDAGARDRIIAKLKAKGLEKVGDRPIEEIIVARRKLEPQDKDFSQSTKGVVPSSSGKAPKPFAIGSYSGPNSKPSFELKKKIELPDWIESLDLPS